MANSPDNEPVDVGAAPRRRRRMEIAAVGAVVGAGAALNVGAVLTAVGVRSPAVGVAAITVAVAALIAAGILNWRSARLRR